MGKISNAGNNGKKWKAIKEGLLLDKEEQSINEIRDDNRIITDDQEIASTFKVHIETCAHKLTEGLPTGTDASVVINKVELGLLNQQQNWNWSK